jgi:hypothetical protein
VQLAATLAMRLEENVGQEYAAGSARMARAVRLRDLLAAENPFLVSSFAPTAGEQLRRIVSDMHGEESVYSPYSDLLFPHNFVAAAPRACPVQFCNQPECETDDGFYQRLMDDVAAFRAEELVPSSLARNCTGARNPARKIIDSEMQRLEEGKLRSFEFVLDLTIFKPYFPRLSRHWSQKRDSLTRQLRS